jgi:hypothetical protein
MLMKTRIQFQGRDELIRQIQQHLRATTHPNLVVDGLDGKATIEAIADSIPVRPPVAFAGQARGLEFPGRRDVIRRIQGALNDSLGTRLDPDGRDGAWTWSAIAQRILSPAPVPQPTYPRPDLLAPFTTYPEIRAHTPHVSRNKTNECRGVVLHHAAGFFAGTISWLANPASKVSYHCLIDEDGTRATFAGDRDVTWHAGVSSWNGRGGCNGFTLGLSFVGNTNGGQLRKHGPGPTDDEVASALEWLLPRAERFEWTEQNITAHRIVSPGRKDDTSIFFLTQMREALKKALL